jgi:hypothetical protein
MLEASLPVLVQLPQSGIAGKHWTWDITQGAEKGREQIIQDE